MSNLDVINLIEKTGQKPINDFGEKVTSSLQIKTDYEEVVNDLEWIDKMEETIQYLDNIFRNPNRFIINEEEIVKIELARKITVDSIKHLSKNTNLIQEIDKKTGDVRPSKILNINKEESYDTYENRFIYSLIQNMKIFIEKRKKTILEQDNIFKKNNKNIKYNGESKVDIEKINISLELSTDIDNKDAQNEKDIILERIENLGKKITDITSSEVYKILDKKHISLVTSPIKKTNVILKNVNFQYAVKLWNYLQENFEDKTKHVSDQQEYMDNGQLKKLMDESFVIDYLIAKTLDKENEQEDNIDEVAQEIKEEQDTILKTNLTQNMIEKIVELNSNLTKEQLNNMVSNQYEIIKYRNMATIQELQKIFKKHIDKYLQKIK